MTRVTWLSVGVGAVFLMLFSVVHAPAVNADDVVSLETLHLLDDGKNKYVLAGDAVVQEKIQGDVYGLVSTFAAPNFIVGDVGLIAGEIHVTKLLDGDIRAISNELRIEDTVTGEVIYIGDSLVLGEVSAVHKGVRAFANSVVIDGIVDGDVTVVAKDVEISGKVYGDLFLHSDNNLRIHSGAVIEGDVAYFAPKRNILQVANDAAISGSVDFNEKNQDFLQGALSVLLTTLILGLVALALVRKNKELVTGVSVRDIVMNSLIGLAFLLFSPLLVLFTFFIPFTSYLGFVVLLLLLLLILFAGMFAPVFFGTLLWRMFKKEVVVDIKTTIIGSFALAALALVSFHATIFMLVILFVVGTFVRMFKDRFLA